MDEDKLLKIFSGQVERLETAVDNHATRVSAELSKNTERVAVVETELRGVKEHLACEKHAETLLKHSKTLTRHNTILKVGIALLSSSILATGFINFSCDVPKTEHVSPEPSK